MKHRHDHIWLIGASAGIGEALAKELAAQGHSIALSARNEKLLARLHDTLPKTLSKNGHLVMPLDVSHYDSIVQARETILARWPQIDRVIFMAGIYQPMKMGDLNLDESRRILDINLMGAFHVVEAALPALLKRSGSQIALCASVAGYRGLPQSQPYGASKAGLINMAESLKIEYGKTLDVKLINPGFVETRLTDKNDFNMPMRISAQKAARAIVKGLESRRFEIHFPKRFTLLMKMMSRLPDWIYYKIMRSSIIPPQ